MKRRRTMPGAKTGEMKQIEAMGKKKEGRGDGRRREE